MPLPRDVQTFAYAADPADQLDYAIDLSELLETDQINASTLVVTLDPVAVTLGLQLLGGALAPVVTADGQSIILWLAVDAASRDDPAWGGYGRELGINVQFSTRGTPARRYDRDVAIMVRSRG